MQSSPLNVNLVRDLEKRSRSRTMPFSVKTHPLHHCVQSTTPLKGLLHRVTHYTCGELRPSHLTETVTLCGWVDRVRDHKGVIFIDLRDRWGKTRVVIGPDAPASVMERARAARPEWVMSTTGRVGRRPEGTTNPSLTLVKSKLSPVH